MFNLLASNNHPYVFCYSSPQLEERVLNLFLKYERLLSGEAGDAGYFYSYRDIANLNNIVNLVCVDCERGDIFLKDFDVLNFIKVSSSDLSLSARRAAFCVFGWDQVYQESV